MLPFETEEGTELEYPNLEMTYSALLSTAPCGRWSSFQNALRYWHKIWILKALFVILRNLSSNLLNTHVFVCFSPVMYVSCHENVVLKLKRDVKSAQTKQNHINKYRLKGVINVQIWRWKQQQKTHTHEAVLLDAYHFHLRILFIFQFYSVS